MIKLDKSINNGTTTYYHKHASPVETSASREPSKLRKLKSTEINYIERMKTLSRYIKYEIKP